MRANLVIALSFGLFLAAGGTGRSEIQPADVLDTGPENEAVSRALGWERLQRDVLYLRPEAPFVPDQKISIAIPETPDSPEVEARTARWTWGLVFLGVLLVIGYIIARNANRIQVSFGQPRERTRGKASKQGAGADGEALPADGLLERLAAMADRREALILLVQRALERAATANDLQLARAQTARDVVRVIPGGWRHRDALRRLVREAEVVHFGGRDLSEERWQDCLATARPIFGYGRAA